MFPDLGLDKTHHLPLPGFQTRICKNIPRISDFISEVELSLSCNYKDYVALPAVINKASNTLSLQHKQFVLILFYNTEIGQLASGESGQWLDRVNPKCHFDWQFPATRDRKINKLSTGGSWGRTCWNSRRGGSSTLSVRHICEDGECRVQSYRSTSRMSFFCVYLLLNYEENFQTKGVILECWMSLEYRILRGFEGLLE